MTIDKRPYLENTDKPVSFFIGTEVEKTDAFGMKTLFVVGNHPADTILKVLEDSLADAIYVGANQSISNLHSAWKGLILANQLRRETGLVVTLDIPVECSIMRSMYPELFTDIITMISVPIPRASADGRVFIKIDDIGFAESNPGVWVHSLDALTSDDSFTEWNEYTKDEVIK